MLKNFQFIYRIYTFCLESHREPPSSGRVSVWGLACKVAQDTDERKSKITKQNITDNSDHSS